MSKRITLTDEQVTEVKNAINIVLNECYNEEWVEDCSDSFEGKIEAMAKRNRLKSILEKL